MFKMIPILCVLLLVGCTDASSTSSNKSESVANDPTRSVVKDIYYVYDSRTEVCFAMKDNVISGYMTYATVTSITAVPSYACRRK